MRHGPCGVHRMRKFIPPRGNFVKVDALPVLGTGKMDLRTLKRIAIERLGMQA